MKKITSLLFLIIIIFNSGSSADITKKIKRISEGKESAEITIITYESLTCSHCADFHQNISPDLNKEFLDKDNFTHVAFSTDKTEMASDSFGLADQIYESFTRGQ